jgi:hypothetical protein
MPRTGFSNSSALPGTGRRPPDQAKMLVDDYLDDLAKKLETLGRLQTD